LKSNLSEIPSTKIIAVSIDPTMQEEEFDKFRKKNKLSTLDSNLIYSGNMMDYEIDLWKNLLNEQ
jgi:penicillin-binding protein-related factor A (putative recombinase)